MESDLTLSPNNSMITWPRIFFLMKCAAKITLFLFLIIIPFLSADDLKNVQRAQSYQTGVCIYNNCTVIGTVNCGCSKEVCDICYTYDINFSFITDSDTYSEHSIVTYQNGVSICQNNKITLGQFTTCYYWVEDIKHTLTLVQSIPENHATSISILCLLGLIPLLVLIGLFVRDHYLEFRDLHSSASINSNSLFSHQYESLPDEKEPILSH